MKKYILILLSLLIPDCAKESGLSQNGSVLPAPEFANESEVIINGYNSHAMEPFITKSGKFLFFNDTNDAVNTSLHYAISLNDTIFSYGGKISGVNGEPPHLDAVPSMDDYNNFYFVSLRNYPAALENLQTVQFDEGAAANVHPVKGDFYINSPGWIVMDAEINKSGGKLFYTNSHFSGGPLPDQSRIGIAGRTDTVFNKIPQSDYIMNDINNPDYLVYAPSISSDEKELYFTRLRKGTIKTEICVAVRQDSTQAFRMPKALDIPGNIVEAPSLALDQRRIYYHKLSTADNKFHIFTMTRK